MKPLTRASSRATFCGTIPSKSVMRGGRDTCGMVKVGSACIVEAMVSSRQQRSTIREGKRIAFYVIWDHTNMRRRTCLAASGRIQRFQSVPKRSKYFGAPQKNLDGELRVPDVDK
jgi:hypothetical protein